MVYQRSKLVGCMQGMCLIHCASSGAGNYTFYYDLYSKVVTFYSSRTTIKIKGQVIEWERSFSYHLYADTNKEIISRAL